MSYQLEMPLECMLRHKIHVIEKPTNLIISCLNPEHDDRSPSMQVHRETGMFNCFSCGMKGSYRDLRRILGDEDTPQDDLLFKAAKLSRTLNQAYHSHEQVEVEAPGNKFGVGGKFKNIPRVTLDKLGAFCSNNEEFANRVWIPVTHFKKTIAFQGRATDIALKPKYLFHPRSVYLKPVIWGIDTVPAQTVVLVEGMYDALNLREHGIKEACSIFGSHVGLERIYTLLTYDIRQVILMFDPDDAGKAATNKALNLFRKKAPQLAVEPVYLNGPEDPGDLSLAQVNALINQEPLSLFLRRNNETTRNSTDCRDSA